MAATRRTNPRREHAALYAQDTVTLPFIRWVWSDFDFVFGLFSIFKAMTLWRFSLFFLNISSFRPYLCSKWPHDHASPDLFKLLCAENFCSTSGAVLGRNSVQVVARLCVSPTGGAHPHSWTGLVFVVIYQRVISDLRRGIKRMSVFKKLPLSRALHRGEIKGFDLYCTVNWMNVCGDYSALHSIHQRCGNDAVHQRNSAPQQLRAAAHVWLVEKQF